MRVKVGEYIRDKKGNITKIINTLSLFKDVELYLGEDDYQYSDNSIIKHSKDIIDLIEVGDYVNGGYVYEIGEADNGEKWVHTTEGFLFYNEDIKSVVTKEQFENMKYVVGEEK